jgi:methionyl-tRNA formyltransferase
MRIVFIGTGEIGVPTLQALQKSEHELVGIVTQPDKPVGRDLKITPPPIKAAFAGQKMSPDSLQTSGSFKRSDALAAKKPIEGAGPSRLEESAALWARSGSILQPPRIKDRQSVEEIRALQPDVIVVLAYGQILPRSVLEIPKLACLNLHASLLPRWRGAAPIQASIAAGDHETGITVMYMDEGLDTGDILLQRKIGILPNDTGGTLHDRLAQIAPEALLESLRLLAEGNTPRTPQDNALATLAPKLNREDGRIDWSEPAEVIERKIRAYNPWPGAFTKVWDGQHERSLTLKIFSAVIMPEINREPGAVIHADDDGLVFATGHGALALLELQLEGKERMTVAKFVRGHRWIARPIR